MSKQSGPSDSGISREEKGETKLNAFVLMEVVG